MMLDPSLQHQHVASKQGDCAPRDHSARYAATPSPTSSMDDLDNPSDTMKPSEAVDRLVALIA